VTTAILVTCLSSAASRASAQVPADFKFEFVTISPGEFMMGCSAGDTDCSANEKPAHRVRITKAFEIGKYEVTQAMWESVMGAEANGSPQKAPDLPANAMFWEYIQEFIQKLNARQDGYRYRLPTEAEWEYAARAGTTSRFYGPLESIAWYFGNRGQSLFHPVGQKQPNAWGLHDMLGNVSEWVQDWYDPAYYQNSPESDPTGPMEGQRWKPFPPGPSGNAWYEYRVLRGGSYQSLDKTVRVSNRYDYAVRASDAQRDGRLGPTGFRLVREQARPVVGLFPAFDQVFIKHNTTTTMPGWNVDRHRALLTGVTVRDVILRAYGLRSVPDYLISDLPAWADADRFDIDAKAALPIPSQADANLMILSILFDRFKLKLHGATRDMPVYALVVSINEVTKMDWLARQVYEGRSGPKNLVEVGPLAPGGPISSIANFLEQRLDLPVLDRTGLKGRYQFKLDWTPGESIFLAVEEQLGLRLEKQGGPVQVIVVDQLQRPVLN